jgi:hypothetical protein
VKENPGVNRAAVARVDPATNCVDAVAFVGTTDAEGSTHRPQRISDQLRTVRARVAGRLEPFGTMTCTIRKRDSHGSAKFTFSLPKTVDLRGVAMVDSSAAAVDVEAVATVATEYFQSWFAGDGERMRACLHPALAKRTPEQPGTESITLHEDPTEQLVVDTAGGEGTGFEPVQQVTVLDVFRDIATVMVRSAPFVEYLHVARFGDRWLIVNALYCVLV